MVSRYECVALRAAARRLLQEPCRSGMQPGQEVITKKGKSQKEKADHSCSPALLTAVARAGLHTPARSTAAAADQNLVFTGRPVVPQVRCISAQNLTAILSLVKKPRCTETGPFPTTRPPSCKPRQPDPLSFVGAGKCLLKSETHQAKRFDQAEQKEDETFRLHCYSEPRERHL